MRLIDADALKEAIKNYANEPVKLKDRKWDTRCKAIIADMLGIIDSTSINGWISVTDRLPENAEHPGAFCPKYQVMTKYGITEGWYNPDKGCWYTLVWFLIGRFDEDDIDMERGDIPRISKKIDVTHWMPLPEQPEEAIE